MLNDKTTLSDLSVCTSNGQDDLFAYLDHTVTVAGRDALRHHFIHPPDNLAALLRMQETIRFLTVRPDVWPDCILNGTIIMLTRFFADADHETQPTGLSLWLNAALQRLVFNKAYGSQQFTHSHIVDFLKGCTQLAALAQQDDVPPMLRSHCAQIAGELSHPLVQEALHLPRHARYTDLLSLNLRVRRQLKTAFVRLMHHYALVDAWHSLAVATQELNWNFPDIVDSQPLCFQVQDVYHPLLNNPVTYHANLSAGHNFMILTGANMAGKTTFLRTLGVAALLAHLGMGVPAATFRISFLGGIITNMHVEDNLLKGESYFYAEVLRMKLTARKMVSDSPHLLLLDELFKGTNVHDAFECTRAIIEGMQHYPGHIIVLSTHLYEVAARFANDANLQFARFETIMDDHTGFSFTYRLLPGISDDRIGYRILCKEGVIDLLNGVK